MVRTTRRWPKAWLQPYSAVEPEKSDSVSYLEEQEDAKKGKIVIDYELGVDDQPEGLDPNAEMIFQKEVKDEAEYSKIELHCLRIKTDNKGLSVRKLDLMHTYSMRT